MQLAKTIHRRLSSLGLGKGLAINLGNLSQHFLGVRLPSVSSSQRVRLAHDCSKFSEDGIEWLHPASPNIERLSVAAKYAIFNIIAHLTINTAKPLRESHFQEALTHLSRKSPSLRTCLRQREGGELWVCEYAEPKIAFKMMQKGDLSTEINKLFCYRFEDFSNGPLWSARVIPAHPDTPCPLPELKADFPYQYELLFVFHHGLNDGATSILCLRNFVNLLENVVSGVPVSPEAYGKVASQQQTLNFEKEMLRRLESNPQHFQNMIDKAANVRFTPLLQQAFGTPPKPDFPMDVVSINLDSHSFQKFRSLCRDNGITTNSGITSAINTALVELVAEQGVERDTYCITSRHAINMRRYWKGNSMTDFGNHMSLMSNTMNTPRHNRNGFWEYAKEFDREFQRQLKDGDVFKQSIIKSRIQPKDFSYDSFFSSPPPEVVDYMITNINMPLLSNLTTGNVVQFTGFRCFDNIANCDYSNLHGFGLFRDSVVYCLIFATERISRDTARAFQEKVIDVIYSLTR